MPPCSISKSTWLQFTNTCSAIGNTIGVNGIDHTLPIMQTIFSVDKITNERYDSIWLVGWLVG